MKCLIRNFDVYSSISCEFSSAKAEREGGLNIGFPDRKQQTDCTVRLRCLVLPWCIE